MDKNAIVPKDPGRVAWSALYVGAALGDLALASAGLAGGLGTVVSAAQSLFTQNTQEAEAESDRVIDAEQLDRAELDRLRADVDELQRRATLWLRLVLESGRHPEREVRLAMGRFGARCLIEDLASVDAFEMAEALARLTALDLAVLQAVGEGHSPGDATRTNRDAELVVSTANMTWIQNRVEERFPAITRKRVDAVCGRLNRAGLTDTANSEVHLGDVNVGRAHLGDTVATVLTPLGRALLRLTREPVRR